MPTRQKNATKSSILKHPKKKLSISVSPSSPPRLDLPPLLKKSWEFVRNAEEAEGRTLAPLTGSALEAQLLIHRIEVRCFGPVSLFLCAWPDACVQSSCTVEAFSIPALERQLSIIEDLPHPLPDVTEREWSEFRASVMQTIKFEK